MPFNASQVRASLQRNAAVIAGVDGLYRGGMRGVRGKSGIGCTACLPALGHVARLTGIGARGLYSGEPGAGMGGLGTGTTAGGDQNPYEPTLTFPATPGVAPIDYGMLDASLASQLPGPTQGQSFPTIGPVNTTMQAAPNTAAGTSALLSLTNAAATRLAVPQLNPGQTIETLPNGTQILTQQAAGYPIGSTALGLSTTGSSGMLLLLAAGVAVVLMMGKK
jgi:hypothetical protein